MTIAICIHCGSRKFGALLPCKTCGQPLHDSEERALSIALSDHFYDLDDLDAYGARIAQGERLYLSEAFRAKLLTGNGCTPE